MPMPHGANTHCRKTNIRDMLGQRILYEPSHVLMNEDVFDMYRHCHEGAHQGLTEDEAAVHNMLTYIHITSEA